MADGRTHDRVAMLVGVGVGLYSARDLDGAGALARVAGAVLGARLRGSLPDVLEPAMHSWHRGSFHSLTAGAASTLSVLQPPEWIRAWFCAREADAHRLRTEREALPPSHPDRTGLWSSEMLCQLMLGAAAGFVAGYISHLVLDARTPRGLPLL